MTQSTPVAIVGMAVLLPGARDLESYWHNLVNGVDAITEVPADRWDADFYHPGSAAGAAKAEEVYCRRGGFVEASFDPVSFGIMPNSVAGAEPDQLIALRVAAAAIADAGGQDRLPAPDRIGVVLGRGGYLTPGLVRLDQRVRTAHQLAKTLGDLLPDLGADQLAAVRQAFVDQLGPASPESAIGLVPNLAASRIANRLDLRGPAYTVDAACASSLVAVDQAVTELAAGRCDVMLAGGVHHCHDVTFWSVFSQLRALSKDQQIRPFDRRADGILIGEGTGVVVLKRLADAQRDGDRVYAVIRGTGVASDGRSASLFNPEPEGQVLALQRAWAAAGLDPAAPGSVGLLEAHGTATPAGDGAELATLQRVFGSEGPSAVIGSVKSMIGHTMPAAGVASLVKAALALHRQVLLPTLHCEQPHADLAQTRFRPLDTAQPWELSEGQDVRRAAVNAFGFGGINAHVVLEEAPSTVDRPAITVTEPERVLTISAPTPARMAELLDLPDAEIRSTAPSTEDGCRLGIVAPTAKRLGIARKVVGKQVAWRGRNDVWFSPEPLLANGGKVAFVYPGLEADFEPRVDDVAAHFGLTVPGLDTGNVGAHGAGVVGVGRLLDTVLRKLGVQPDHIAGHSVGEWTAMITSGIYEQTQIDEFLAGFDPDSLRVPGVVFAAFGCGADRVTEVMAGRHGVVLSHDNAPNQSIVCGLEPVVQELVLELRAKNVLGQVLPFRSGFHTPMLAPYLDPIREAAAGFRLHEPSIPMWSATTAAPFPEGEQAKRELFIRHLLEPVRFRPLVQAMHAAGVRAFIQVGTGALSTLVSDCLAGQEHLSISANSPKVSGLGQLRRVLTGLWAEGAPTHPDRLDPAPRKTRAGKEIPLDLSATTVRLGGDLPGAIKAAVAPARPPAPVGDLGGAFAELDRLAAQFPLAGELGGLLRDTADTATAVLGAVGSAPVARVAAPAPPQPLRTTLHVSTETMPYLRDHSFYRTPADWPDDTDRFPVVPATTMIKHMMDAAEAAAPGQRAVTVHNVRLFRWLVVAPPTQVEITVTPMSANRVKVTLGQNAEAEVALAPAYPAADLPVWTFAEREWAPKITARQLYDERFMFHGPLYQGVTALEGIGEHHIRGEVTVPGGPGALLDNVGQVFGYWIMENVTDKRVVFPMSMDRIRFFGPEPEPGARLDCLVRITELTDTVFGGAMQLVHEGRVWCEIDAWLDRRFASNENTKKVERFPEHNRLSERRDAGFLVVWERWPDVASRDLMMRIYLNAAERAEYEATSPRVRRRWLLGRMAVKDAVRQHLWDGGAGPMFPVELTVTGEATVAGRNPLPPLTVCTAQQDGVGVAFARDGQVPTGIDIRAVEDSPDNTAFAAALTAAARAHGGQAAEYEVVGAEGDTLTVRGATGSTTPVTWTVITDPDGEIAGEYVVAWTKE
ncbi:beta-ketoacyl synthase N-terminal-like domain-containing protein [Crossiella sp. CA-258035]|uniref:beta-ketoacyl synthase N-terminal-like domain-containing protein n=1 Tax=Crossiella sp. CA-258035 TaxID=2981138 RepID=UPI0024BC50F6|nr:beta-ketoacyl synthase N-terminal-like domain-containing protein [Crossiella sp. CA-258035]WHT17020.1 beta-ketoacyl synthase N-terminal-like domain-containing protein [Crossiella sp. CA-258035]